MIRQRIRVRGLGAADAAVRLVVSLLALALVFYGAMVVLAALKLGPHTIDSISAYRTVYDDLASITAGDITGRDRIIVAVAGVLCLIVLGPLAWRALPRPYLARTSAPLDDGPGPGHTALSPRALERAAELAAERDDHVGSATARYGRDALSVSVELVGVHELIVPLRAVQRRVRESLGEHGLIVATIDVVCARLTP